MIKHFVHFNLSNVLIREKRHFEIKMNTETVLKLLYFLEVPFVFDGAIDEKSIFEIKSTLKPGRKYDFSLNCNWNKFCFPRLVSDNARQDQFYVFLEKFVKSRPNFGFSLKVDYSYKQNVFCDRAIELSSVVKILNAIFSVSVDEYFE
ncbi:hypothetical protein MHBO_002109 [Bonamia ostreae]|uniref:LAGLIDADG homing endonuclease n=1 Tax=Bonamia ostreae TaxID=126728 RepID=A0ABV2ALA8_9EUKA